MATYTPTPTGPSPSVGNSTGAAITGATLAAVAVAWTNKLIGKAPFRTPRTGLLPQPPSETASFGGTRTQPSISRRAERLITTFVASHWPFRWPTSAPTCSVPDGMAEAHAFGAGSRRGALHHRARNRRRDRDGHGAGAGHRVVHLPIENTRASKSMESASTARPSEAT